MGFFSWDCPVCGESIRSRQAEPNPKEAALILHNSVIAGEYDGYGRIITPGGKFNIQEADSTMYGEYVKLYHLECYNKIGRPIYMDAEISHHAADQGYWFNKDAIVEALTGGKPCMPLTLGEAKAKGLPTAGPFYESQPPKKEKS